MPPKKQRDQNWSRLTFLGAVSKLRFLLFLTNQVPLFAIVTIGVPSPFANVSIWGPNSPLFVNKV